VYKVHAKPVSLGAVRIGMGSRAAVVSEKGVIAPLSEPVGSRPDKLGGVQRKGTISWCRKKILVWTI
jgi:hypothetical protein